MADPPWLSFTDAYAKVPGIGKCIYCGSDGEGKGLRREHAMPYSLGGNIEILNASCYRCEAKTSNLIGVLARQVYGDMRAHWGVQSYRKKKRTELLPVTYSISGAPEVTVKVPPKVAPHRISLPKLAPPGILYGQERTPSFTHLGDQIFEYVPPGFYEWTGLDPDTPLTFKFENSLRLLSFTRALSNIAYCASLVAQREVGGDPSVPPRSQGLMDVILGIDPCASYYVGGVVGDPGPPDPGRLHVVGSVPVRVGSRIFLVAYMRLFALFGSETKGMPMYQVVLGDVTSSELTVEPVLPEEIAHIPQRTHAPD